MRISFAWYDLWVGAYWSRSNRTLYVCLVPMVLLTFQFGDAPTDNGRCCCQNYEAGAVSNCCPVHNDNPAEPAPGCWCRKATEG